MTVFSDFNGVNACTCDAHKRIACTYDANTNAHKYKSGPHLYHCDLNLVSVPHVQIRVARYVAQFLQPCIFGVNEFIAIY